MSFTADDEKYMRRALALAENGRGYVSPNPMVGAVIVSPDGYIIGEGWHRRFGGPHAEVNAINSVDEHDVDLLPFSTMYVTLEPCSHYGKTPPCADLLIEKKLKRVVVAIQDPNPKVSGRGIEKLRQAGVEVEVGLLKDEAYNLNLAFMISQVKHIPYVELKWARSRDGYMDIERGPGEPAYKFSNAQSQQLVHWRRANYDAIAIGGRTAVMDNPRLDVRMLDGRSPRPVIFDRQHLANKENCALLRRPDTLHITDGSSLYTVLRMLYREYGISSILVEGGAGLLTEFIEEDLWDMAYEEVVPIDFHEEGVADAPTMESDFLIDAQKIGANTVFIYRRYSGDDDEC